MMLNEFLAEDLVLVLEAPADKKALLRQLAELAAQRLPGLDVQTVYKGLLVREEQATTGVGLGIAIPHSVVSGLEDNQLLVCRVRGGLDYDAIDGEPVHLVFMVLAPENRPGRYLQLLARITRLVHRTRVRELLMSQDNPHDLYRLLREEDARYPGHIPEVADAPHAASG
jgi:nitrogen PTS system EIIA component